MDLHRHRLRDRAARMLDLRGDDVLPRLVVRVRRRVAAPGVRAVAEVDRARRPRERSLVRPDLDVERDFPDAGGCAGLNDEIRIGRGALCHGRRRW